jgi:hypothetical protein
VKALKRAGRFLVSIAALVLGDVPLGTFRTISAARNAFTREADRPK